jgi:glutamate/tyrosine decarboxylase-like PLP-dependent enzyme
MRPIARASPSRSSGSSSSSSPPVPDPLTERGEVEPALEYAAGAAREYLRGIEDALVLDPRAEERIRAWSDPIPETGDGTLAALTDLVIRANESATRSSGPRFFHFVMGGGTPAALAADWLTSAYDQIAFAWASSPFASRLEQVSIDWLRQLFELPKDFGGVLTTGATMANFVGLAAARNWWAEQVGVDVEEQGLGGLPAPPILTSGYVHSSAVQAAGMLGLGRGNVRRLAKDGVGRLDLEALSRELEASETPAILIGNAGEVNSGDFDPIGELAHLAERHGAWLHVDGAFGLFARLAPAARSLADGVERADSVACDGHKWLNVPYDCGFAFVRELERLPRALHVGAAYFPTPDEARPSFGFLSPESSRRARSLTVWTTLKAYGREGYRAMVERHLALAQRLASGVDEAEELERLAAVPLNVVCFRARPADWPGDRLDDLNRAVGEAVLGDGRVFAGTTVYDGAVALRPAIVNWRTEEEDVDLLVDVVRELVAEEVGRA